MKSIYTLISITTLTLLSTACGNMTTPAATGTVLSASTAAGGSTASLVQSCSASPNVNSLSSSTNVAAQYSVCNAPSTPGSIELFKADQTSAAICVYPAQAYNGTVSLFLSNPNGSPATEYVSQCTTTQNPGILVNFGGLNFNAVYIINASDAATMGACISAGMVASCAAYYGIQVSYGQFN